ncbi:hypothetical protein A3737_36195, partial [Oleiphilus sp. HI0065]
MHFFRSLSTQSIRSMALLLIVLFVPISSIQAAMVGTDVILETQQNQVDRGQILERLQAEDAKNIMAKLGIDASEIEERVANMTTAELAEFNAKVDTLPAGAGIDIFAFVVILLFL